MFCFFWASKKNYRSVKLIFQQKPTTTTTKTVKWGQGLSIIKNFKTPLKRTYYFTYEILTWREWALNEARRLLSIEGAVFHYEVRGFTKKNEKLFINLKLKILN